MIGVEIEHFLIKVNISEVLVSFTNTHRHSREPHLTKHFMRKKIPVKVKNDGSPDFWHNWMLLRVPFTCLTELFITFLQHATHSRRRHRRGCLRNP